MKYLFGHKLFNYFLTHLFNCTHLKKVFIIFVLLIAALSTEFVQAQNKNRPSMYSLHLPDYDDKPVHYGFFIAIHGSTLNSQYSNAFVNGLDTVTAVNPSWSGGYGLGFIVSYGITKQFDVCVVPAFSYYERNVNYLFSSGFSKDQVLESGFVEASLLARYKSVRRGNVRMYMLAGLKPGVEVGSNAKDRGLNSLRTQNWDVALQYGFGFDLFYPFFKLSPELRFSHGLSNMLVKEDNIYSRNLTQLKAHTVSLYLYF